MHGSHTAPDDVQEELKWAAKCSSSLTIQASLLCFVPKISTLVARKKWIVGSIGSSAKIFIDGGAAKALKNGKSLLAAGITKVVGEFKKGDNILVVDNNEHELARGLSSFSSKEIEKIKGLHSDKIEGILGYASKSEIIHQDDMVKL